MRPSQLSLSVRQITVRNTSRRLDDEANVFRKDFNTLVDGYMATINKVHVMYGG